MEYVIVQFKLFIESTKNTDTCRVHTNFPFATANFRAFDIKSLYWGILAAASIRLGFVVASVGLYFFMARKKFE